MHEANVGHASFSSRSRRHEAAGVTAPSTQWFLAEGATGPLFDLFVLLANPTNNAAAVSVDYLLTTGETFTKTYVVPRDREPWRHAGADRGGERDLLESQRPALGGRQ